MKILKLILLLFFVGVAYTWFNYVPKLHASHMQMDKLCLAESYITLTPSPQGMHLWSPYVFQEREVNFTQHKTAKDTQIIKSWAVPLAPLITYYNFEIHFSENKVQCAFSGIKLHFSDIEQFIW